MKPFTLTRFWHRRICEAVGLVCVLILVLYFWVYFADVDSIASALLVSDVIAIFAGVSLIASVIFYLWAPRQHIFSVSFIMYVLLLSTSAALIVSTGGVSSPFVALWMLVGLFAGIFGIYGMGVVFASLAGYIIYSFLQADILTQSFLWPLLLVGFMPVIISYILWHPRNVNSNNEDRAYEKLASELSQVANKSEVVINAIADGVIAIDSAGTIQLINPAAQQIIGWGKQDALSLDYKLVLKLTDDKNNELLPAQDPIAQVFNTNQEVTSNNLMLLTNSGKKLFVSVIVSPAGQPGSGAIVVFRDITKSKSEEREQAEFISTASHEMRTPVASIEGYLGLALNPATAQIDDKARDYIQKAHESAQHLGNLFQDLLDVSKADDGRLSNHPKVVDVVAFAAGIVEGLKPKADEKGLRIMYKPQPNDMTTGSERRLNPVFYVNVDNDHLREVIANLVENAIKYTLQGNVIIDVQGDTDHVIVSVADSGIGIPKEDMSHLFQKFYRVDNTDTREIGGTGLGLYLCRRLAEAMNGRIYVESEYKKGSTFFVELPRIAHEDAINLIEQAARQDENKPTVTQFEAKSPLPLSVPEAEVPVPAQQEQQPPQITPPSPANTSLSSIEEHPEQYIRRPNENITIPPR